MWTRPVLPSGRETNAPKGLRPVTLPSTISPTCNAKLEYPFFFGLIYAEGLPQSAPAEPTVPQLFAADIHEHALIGLGIALFPGVTLDDRIIALLQRIREFCVFGKLAVELVLYAQQFLLLGADGYLIVDQADKQIAAKQIGRASCRERV